MTIKLTCKSELKDFRNHLNERKLDFVSHFLKNFVIHVWKKDWEAGIGLQMDKGFLMIVSQVIIFSTDPEGSNVYRITFVWKFRPP